MEGIDRIRSLLWFAVGAGVTVAVTSLFSNAFQVDAAPGDSDSTFVPITSCRLVNTRPQPFRVGEQGMFVADDTKTFSARGDNGECALPADAVGLTLNVTALDATAPTYLAFWPDGDRPNGSSLNPAPGQPPTPNAVTVDLADDGRFRVFNLQGSVEVIIDVTGFYTSTSLIELANRVTALEARTDGLDSRTSHLESSQPFVVEEFIGGYDESGSATEIDTSTTTVGEITLTAPAPGRVTVTATGVLNDDVSGAFGFFEIECGLLDAPVGMSTSDALTWTPSDHSTDETISQTRTFPVEPGASTFFWRCTLPTPDTLDDAVVRNVRMTALFTPGP